MASDGPALLAAAVRAACLAKAPRRTTQAVAAAVAGVILRPPTAAAVPGPTSAAPAGPQRAAEGAGDASPEALLAALRSARAGQRKRKKERRKAAKFAAPTGEDAEDQQMGNCLGGDGGLPAVTADVAHGVAVVDTAESHVEVHGEAVVDAAESHVEEGGGSPSARQVELTGLLVAQRKSEQFHIAREGAGSEERLIRLRRRIKETEEELAGGRVGRRERR
ncbi:unnamed protein product [Polarella glacialis]|uniref:Uncharacterized protein n=1 Tax=Polarella glacialis TaxID=89957 RepID=A0A813JD60_POLGL|nr:unnamed protein product [Polarella glacialis]